MSSALENRLCDGCHTMQWLGYVLTDQDLEQLEFNIKEKSGNKLHKIMDKTKSGNDTQHKK